MRATVGGPTTSAHLTAPLLADDLTEELARALVGTALRWTVERGAHRVVAEVPHHSPRAFNLLGALGFRDAFRLLTLVHPLEG